MSRSSSRVVVALVLTCATLSATIGCAPEPSSTASASPSTVDESPSVTVETPTPAPSASATETTDALPDDCTGIYSADMRAQLEAQAPPLNDPGITMLTTQIAEGLEVLDSGVTSLRCTWGLPSEHGLATSVAVVTADQATNLDAAFQNAGMSVQPLGDGTLYQVTQRVVTQDDELVTLGEVHYLGDGGWVATNWINVLPEGYTEDIVTTLWG